MLSLPEGQRGRAVFVDTSAFYADLDRDDRWHQEAMRGFRQLAQERRPMVTTNLVIAEAYNLALLRLGAEVAHQWFTGLGPFPALFQRREHHVLVSRLLDGRRDVGFSYTDAFSFIAMEELGLRLAFAFDRHFQAYGWTLFQASLS